MNSLDKLQKIRHDFYNNDELDYDSFAYFTAIKKDLEMLEKIKKVLLESESGGWIEFNINYKDELDKEGTKEMKEIKRWLYGNK